MEEPTALDIVKAVNVGLQAIIKDLTAERDELASEVLSVTPRYIKVVAERNELRKQLEAKDYNTFHLTAELREQLIKDGLLDPEEYPSLVKQNTELRAALAAITEAANGLASEVAYISVVTENNSHLLQPVEGKEGNNG